MRSRKDLWKKAQGAQREAFRSMRAKARRRARSWRVEIDKPGARLEAIRAAARPAAGANAGPDGSDAQRVREAWFAV